MAQELREGVLPAAAFRYRRVLAWASAISFVSILMTFRGWFPTGESRLFGSQPSVQQHRSATDCERPCELVGFRCLSQPKLHRLQTLHLGRI